MLGGAWLFIVLALLIPTLVLRQPALVMVTIMVIFIGGLARIWAKYLFTRVEYSRRISTRRAFFGDEITIELQATNRKLLPLPWFRIFEDVPEEISFVEGTLPGLGQNRRMLSVGLSLRWYHRVTRRFVAHCTKRGTFSFGPARLEAGDIFGFFRRSISETRTDRLLVYPRIVPLEQLGIPSKELFGDIRVRRHLFEDPVRVVATRDYSPADPMKRIHWKTSARLGRLQTRVFEPTTSVDAAIFLDTRTVPPPIWGFVAQLLELGVITAASIATYASERDIRVGLYVNQPTLENDRMIAIPPSSHPEQLMHILEALAQVHAQEFAPISRLVQAHGRSLPWNTTMAVITAVPTDALMTTLVQHRRAGRRVALIVPGGSSHGGEAIPTYAVPNSLSWDAVESIELQGGPG